ncbi:MAG: thioredoxin family protein [Candidatus Methanofastidiosia archaeon]|jgi:thiol-disulfide isomerase/thioredoxin
MKSTILIGSLAALLLTGCITQMHIPEPIKAEVVCPCDCHLTLERCELEDPHCNTRKAVEERIETLMEKGLTPDEIIAYFEQPEIMPLDELQRHIAAQYELGTPFILYFYSSSCGTCIRVRPKIEEIEQKVPSVNLFKIEKQFHDPIFSQYNVETYPLLIVVVNGTEYKKSVSEPDDILLFVKEVLG